MKQVRNKYGVRIENAHVNAYGCMQDRKTFFNVWGFCHVIRGETLEVFLDWERATPPMLFRREILTTRSSDKKNFDKLTKILLKNCTNFGMLVKNGMSENPTARQQFWEKKY